MAIMFPQVGVGGATLSPRNERMPSITMTARHSDHGNYGDRERYIR